MGGAHFVEVNVVPIRRLKTMESGPEEEFVVSIHWHFRRLGNLGGGQQQRSLDICIRVHPQSIRSISQRARTAQALSAWPVEERKTAPCAGRVGQQVLPMLKRSTILLLRSPCGGHAFGTIILVASKRRARGRKSPQSVTLRGASRRAPDQKTGGSCLIGSSSLEHGTDGIARHAISVRVECQIPALLTKRSSK